MICNLHHNGWFINTQFLYTDKIYRHFVTVSFDPPRESQSATEGNNNTSNKIKDTVNQKCHYLLFKGFSSTISQLYIIKIQCEQTNGKYMYFIIKSQYIVTRITEAAYQKALIFHQCLYMLHIHCILYDIQFPIRIEHILIIFYLNFIILLYWFSHQLYDFSFLLWKTPI